MQPIVTEATVYFISGTTLVALCPKRLMHYYDISRKDGLKSLQAGDMVLVQYLDGFEHKVLSVTPIRDSVEEGADNV